MAVVSTAPTLLASNTAVTPPSSFHGDGYSWDSPPSQTENSAADGTNGDVLRLVSQQEADDGQLGASWNDQDTLAESLTEQHKKPLRNSSNDSNKRAVATDTLDGDPDDTNSKWIHRDKLARIESEELQAAGIILPTPRARSKPRRDRSVDRATGNRRGGLDADGHAESRSRGNSIPDRRNHDPLPPSWDLRLPEEIAAEAYFVPPNAAKGLSRIPVAKLSPAPIPMQHMERDTLLARTRDDSPGAEESLAYPNSRSRSSSILKMGDAAVTSPRRTKKPAASTATGPSGSSRRTSKTTSNGHSKTRHVSRPTTRSGERELSPGASGKRPEGEPPWMISAYRPDPRLPPDQQLLPTVARRLQQEKWEREGKFGNVYDKEFRPLTDDGFLPHAETSGKSTGVQHTASTAEKPDGWPLKGEDIKIPTLPTGRVGSYSTIPKIQEKPTATASPLPSPRAPMPQAADSEPPRASAPAKEEEDSSGGCGCCIIM